MMKALFRYGALIGLALTPVAALAKKDKGPVDPDKKFCRSEMVTGSNMRKSTCHTKAEWEAIDGANAESARNLRDSMAAHGMSH